MDEPTPEPSIVAYSQPRDTRQQGGGRMPKVVTGLIVGSFVVPAGVIYATATYDAQHPATVRTTISCVRVGTPATTIFGVKSAPPTGLEVKVVPVDRSVTDVTLEVQFSDGTVDSSPRVKQISGHEVIRPRSAAVYRVVDTPPPGTHVQQVNIAANGVGFWDMGDYVQSSASVGPHSEVCR